MTRTYKPASNKVTIVLITMLVLCFGISAEINLVSDKAMNLYHHDGKHQLLHFVQI